ncbi:hypothetical protein D3C74_333070 [compost metagenome]
MGRQHLAVCIHIHSGSFRLLEQRLHILQVMSADQNPRTGSHTDVHFGNFRVAVSRCIRPVQQRHDLYTQLPAFQHQRSQFVAAERVIQHCRQTFFHKSLSIRLIIAQYRRMLHISRHPFESIGQQLAQRTDILMFCGKNTYFLCF